MAAHLLVPGPGPVSGEALPDEVAAALAAHGVAPGPAGYDAATLAEAAAARGLTTSVEAVAGARPAAAGRYRAVVWRTVARDAPGRPGGSVVAHEAARGRGRTEAAALGTALARWLGKAAGGG